MRSLLLLSLVAAAPLAVGGCGGSDCGNGVVESGEDCDKGAQNGQPGVACSSSCKSVSVSIVHLAVSWGIDLTGGETIPGYLPPGCSSFGATQAHLVISGPSPYDKVLDCTRYGLMYAGVCPDNADGGTSCTPLQPGSYQVSVQLLDGSGNPVTNPLQTPAMDVQPGPAVGFPITFGMKDFVKQDYTGTLAFHASWGAPNVACAGATPPVTSESILLTDASGKVVHSMTKLGTPTDGSAPGTCFTSDNMANTYESIAAVPWGKYRLAVYSTMQPYCVAVPVFVNPGATNGAYEIVVNSTTPPMMDAGVSDGGTDDGGMGDGGMSLADGGMGLPDLGMAMTCP